VIDLSFMKKIAIYSVLVISVFTIIFLAVLLNYRPHTPQLEKYLIKPKLEHQVGSLKVQFIGNTNVLITDGKSAILTDGFFTRPSISQVLWGEIEPDYDVIEYCMNRAGIHQLDAVIPVHSHFDHAMDSPIVATMTGAKLIGSESTANIGRGLGFPEDQMIIAESGVPLQIGTMKVTLIKGKHWPYLDEALRLQLLDREILNPIIPPASAFEYYEGASYTIIIEHTDATIAIHGSAGFIPNILENFDVDILFLGMAGLETMDESYNDSYQVHVVDALSPEVIVPIHWDDFFSPLKKGIKPRSLLEKWLKGMDVKKSFEEVEIRNLDRTMAVLPLWELVNVLDLMGNKKH
jgi:L-ascorbate metabolism protein UlaG (beta-lactamase superfamily)